MIHVYGIACGQEENGQKQKEESFKPKIDALRKNFDMASENLVIQIHARLNLVYLILPHLIQI